MPEGREFKFVSASNPFMIRARQLACMYRGKLHQPNGVVIVHDGSTLIGRGSVGMGYHAERGCERIKHGCKTGEGYDLCPGCHVSSHGEAMAIAHARAQGCDPRGADLYLWGHWWCCKDCWDAMIEAGIRDVYLIFGSYELFCRDSPTNIIGRMFEGEAP